jgi:hypothetical protein
MSPFGGGIEGGGKVREEKAGIHLSQRENNRCGGNGFQYYSGNFPDSLINRLILHP